MSATTVDLTDRQRVFLILCSWPWSRSLPDWAQVLLNTGLVERTTDNDGLDRICITPAGRAVLKDDPPDRPDEPGA